MESVSRQPEQADVFRVPWEDLIYPHVIRLPQAPEGRKASPGEGGDVSAFRAPDSAPRDPKPLPFSERRERSPRSREEDDPEGEYVELPPPSFCPQKGSLTQSLSLQVKVRGSTRAPQLTPAGEAPPEATSLHLRASTPPPPPQGSLSCGGKTCMFAKERGGKDSACKEEQTEERINQPDGGRAESDGEEVDAEVVEVEEEVQIRIQQNQDGRQEVGPMREDEKEAEVQAEAGSQEAEAGSSTCSSGPGWAQDPEPSVAPPPAGPEGGVREKEEAADEEGAPPFPPLDERSPRSGRSLAPSLTTAPSLPTDPSPAEAAQPGQRSSFYSLLLRSGAVCLPGEATPFCCHLAAPPIRAWLMCGGSSPGSRDRGGRALLTISARSSAWAHPDRHHAQLLRLLLYYSSTLR